MSKMAALLTNFNYFIKDITMTKLKLIAFVAAFFISSIAPANAAPVTLNVKWSGASFANNATATGFIKFDNSVFPEVGAQNWWDISNAAIIDLGLTISGASSGNGTFSKNDFQAIYFATPSVLNLSSELIGQTLTNGCAFGTSTGACGNGLGGDFNLFGATAGAPTGTYYFQLTTAGGENMLVTSMSRVNAVPVPAAVWLFASGVAGLMGARRKQQAAA
jgi:hypothetical protein